MYCLHNSNKGILVIAQGNIAKIKQPYTTHSVMNVTLIIVRLQHQPGLEHQYVYLFPIYRHKQSLEPYQTH